MKIIVKSPTRVDLAGGTLDLWPLFNFVGGATTINVAISIFTTVELEPLADGQIEIVSKDMGVHKKYPDLRACLADSDPQISLLKAQVEYWKPDKGFRLVTQSDSPVGGGLGGSSSLTIGLLKAFSKWLQKEFISVNQMVHVAHNLEARILNTPTGTQDYFPAASGGINVLRYSANGVVQEILDQKTEEMSQRFLLVYTGKSHHSGLNNFEVLTKAIQKDPQTTKALHELQKIAEKTVATVVRGDWQELPGLFRQEYQERIKLAPAFSSPEIEKLAEVSLQAGAGAVKICGAGGGGCVLVWAEPAVKERVVSACQNAGFQVLAAKPVPRI